ncbi:HlyD family efflux transporter periplasmic adaptor subunit [Streptomyces sp. NBC_00984]|uniref:HlyD family efflux transporter periplasmic adaptor subunit n=1 Tax=Streptomyces sp. NBC_00984 TaxID=2903700 RepID=UPI003870DA62|nr:HlyD family efflux transporter periplasmic adaptor subunit [Streptomyces sp. NBC_00984]
MRFRKQALRKLESPEQLDEIARLASIPTWLTTVALLVVVLSVGTWSAFATVPKTVTAPGVLTHAAGAVTLDATRQGQVGAVLVVPNQRVRKEQPLYTLVSQNGSTVTVTAPWTAHVVSVRISEGEMLLPGSKVAVLERLDTPGDRLEAMVYVPATHAPLLRVGMPVRLSTPVAPVSVFGTLSGTVSAVGSLPETEESLHAFLGADRDVTPFLTAGSVVAVTVRLTPDAESPTGLKWSRSSPSFALNSQSAVSATLTVAQEHPLNWLVNQ